MRYITILGMWACTLAFVLSAPRGDYAAGAIFIVTIASIFLEED
jgi:hypothetical protein